MKKILILPKNNGIGGPSTFQRNFINECSKLGVETTYNFNEKNISSLLLVNGTKYFFKLLYLKLKKVVITHRLGSPTNLECYVDNIFRKRLISQLRIIYLGIIRRFIADKIIYQSEFVKTQWGEKKRIKSAKEFIIYNGVDLNYFKPNNSNQIKIKKDKKIKIISIEGTQGNDPFDILINISEILRKENISHEIDCIGYATNEFINKTKNIPMINILGKLHKSDIKEKLHNADINIQTDYLGAGCPNSALEAMAAGVPVLGYKIGPLPEILGNNLKKILVEPEGDIWRRQEIGNYHKLYESINLVMSDIKNYKSLFLERSKKFDISEMTKEYLKVLSKK